MRAAVGRELALDSRAAAPAASRPRRSTGTVQKRGRRGRRRGPRRREEHARAVGRPALHQVGAGMPGEPRRLAAVGRHHVDVGVAGVLRAERQRAAVGRELRMARLALEARDPPGRAAGALHDPDVAGVGKRDVRGAHRRHAQHARVPGDGVVGRARAGPRQGDDTRRDQGDERDPRDADAHGHTSATPEGDGEGMVPHTPAEGQPGEGQVSAPRLLLTLTVRIARPGTPAHGALVPRHRGTRRFVTLDGSQAPAARELGLPVYVLAVWKHIAASPVSRVRHRKRACSLSSSARPGHRSS